MCGIQPSHDPYSQCLLQSCKYSTVHTSAVQCCYCASDYSIAHFGVEIVKQLCMFAYYTYFSVYCCALHLGSCALGQSTYICIYFFPIYGRDIIGSRTHSRNEQAQNVSDSQKTSKTAAVGGPSADPGRLPEGQKEREEGEEEAGSKGEVLPNTSVPEGMTATAGPLQDREAKDSSGGGGGLPEEQTPPQETNHEPEKTEDRDISKGPVKSWLRQPESISRYPYGNPSQRRIPRTQSVPLHPVSLKSAACASTVKALREARNASMQSAQMISVRTCALTPRTRKEDCLPPLLKPSPRTPPPTALQPIRLSTTIL